MSLLTKVEEIWKTGKFSDVTFLVGSNKEPIMAHRLILKIYSSVFEEILKDKSEEICLEEDPETFKQLLEHIYTDRLELVNSCRDAFNLYNAANKYIFNALKRKCVDFLQFNLATENAIEIYEFSKNWDEIELKGRAMEFCCSNASDILKHDSFAQANLETVTELFKEQSLNVDSELELAEALYNIKRTKKLKPEEIRGPLSYIRFLLLTGEEISSSTAIKDILPNHDLLPLVMHKTTINPSYSWPKDLSRSTTPRN